MEWILPEILENHIRLLRDYPRLEAGMFIQYWEEWNSENPKENGEKIKEKAKRTVDEDGEEGFSFDLSEFCPRVRTVGIEMKIMTKDFNPCRFGGSFKTNWNAPETASQYLEIHWNNFVNQQNFARGECFLCTLCCYDAQGFEPTLSNEHIIQLRGVV